MFSAACRLRESTNGPKRDGTVTGATGDGLRRGRSQSGSSLTLPRPTGAASLQHETDGPGTHNDHHHRPGVHLRLMALDPVRRQRSVHVGGDRDEEDQVSDLEEAETLQTPGRLYDHLVPVQEGRQRSLHLLGERCGGRSRGPPVRGASVHRRRVPAERCFTLVFRGRRGNLDLVAESAEEAQSWIKGMRKLIENVENMGERERLGQWIGDWFKKADKNNDGRMNFKEVRDLLKMMNVDMNEHHAHRLFTIGGETKSSVALGTRFVLFYKMLTQREDLLRVFQEFSTDGQKLSSGTWRLSEGGAAGSRRHPNSGQELMEKYEPSDAAKQMKAMSFDGFLMYLGSAEGNIFDPKCRGMYQDMSQPLNHYFISSSHNTYLMEDQLRGHSSVEGYIRALNRGCRCVEVDCWDGANGEPIVYHGHTFTSKILFKDVVSAVSNYAFKVSPFPVIMSMENHCSVEQQCVMAQHLTHILGDKLLKTTLDGKPPIRLPSPQKSKQRLSKELSDCVVYCKSVHFRSFKHSRIHSKFYEVASFTESKARKQLKEAAHSSLSSGFRTDSSNYNPQEMWNVGCQIVALNFQTAGECMDLNDGLFSQNGGCGYVLKPSFMTEAERRFDPDNPQKLDGYQPLILTIQVISGQQLPKVNIKEGSIVDPLVRVEIHGVPLDQNKQETRWIENNGFNPVWYDTLRFTIHAPELAMVRFVVEDYDKTSKMTLLDSYRHIHLLSKDGTSIPPSSLFVHVRITEL
ncbi:hypothetical protein WMY93_032792 [Mugilogobius chulae]|uniref:Phosphoinositide phospholipase C n=1 Tax=Mugilogobius chulae TaxID=88201 RepID=A0AAW0MTS4_9GOBI